MCGIIGQLAFGTLNEEQEKVRQESMIFLGSELLQMTQEKGKDATGVTLLFDDGNYYGLKEGIPAVEFLSKYGKSDKEYGGFVKVWRKSKKVGRVFLGHCRNTTRGSSLDNENNHPIKIGEIIGIHNGTIQNDDTVFEKLGCERKGAVDSEAIFRLLSHYTKNGTEPFTTEILKETVTKLAGTFAVLAFSGNNPYQVCGFRDRKPIEMALIKPLKLLICATEKKFIETAAYRYNKHINLYMPGTKFPTLKASDVIYKTLQDDSGVVFDLRTEVEKDTDIDELYNWEKMPRTRDWGHGTGNNYSVYQRNVPNTPVKTNKTTGRQGNKKGTKAPIGFIPGNSNDNDKDSSAGRIWMGAIKGYALEGSPEAEEIKSIRNVEIDITGGKTNKIAPPKEEGSEKFALESVGATEVEKDSIVSKPAAIKELEAPSSDSYREKIEKAAMDKSAKKMTSVEIDASVDAKAIEASEECAKTLEQYESIDEVLTDLEIADEDTLRQIPVVALVNRVQKFIFKRGVYKGFLRGKREDGTFGGVKKREAAEKHIRTMKAVTKMLLRIIRFSNYVTNDTLDKVVAEAFEKREEISKENMEKIFTEGDEREFTLLRRMKEVVHKKENR